MDYVFNSIISTVEKLSKQLTTSPINENLIQEALLLCNELETKLKQLHPCNSTSSSPISAEEAGQRATKTRSASEKKRTRKKVTVM